MTMTNEQTNPAKRERHFVHTGLAYYFSGTLLPHGVVDEVIFGPENSDICMRWHDLGSEHPRTPRLEVFNDCWKALGECKDVLRELSKLDANNVSPAQFCQILLRLGFVDRTETAAAKFPPLELVTIGEIKFESENSPRPRICDSFLQIGEDIIAEIRVLDTKRVQQIVDAYNTTRRPI